MRILLSLLFVLFVAAPIHGLSSSSGLPYKPPPSTGPPTSTGPPSTSSLSANQKALPDDTRFPHTWVPLASTYELNPDRPNAVQFLDQHYVVYRDNNDQWIVTDDACPHRLAPLSEGRVDRTTDRLECSYHGWAFDSQGNCQRIPQADPATEAAALQSPRCSVKTYPVTVEKNIIFCWPWPEDSLSIAGDLWKHPEHMCARVVDNPTTYTRDLPYGWDTLMENIVDPSHVPWAHHGLQGKRTDAIAVNMTNPSGVDIDGFSFDFGDRTMGMRRAVEGVFRAPYCVQYEGEFERSDDAKPEDPPRFFNLTALMIPTKPGWSRILLFGGPRERSNDNPRKERFVQKLFRILPPWLIHLASNRFLDSDLVFLHVQEQERQRNDNVYYMPAQADRCVIALRRWIRRFAFVPGPLPPRITHRAVLFDRWSQHTDQCIHCSSAVKGIQKTRTNTYRTLAVSILLLKRFLAARVVAVGCLAMLRLLAWMEPAFKEGGFQHYDND